PAAFITYRLSLFTYFDNSALDPDHLLEPPSQTYEKEAPILKKLRRLAFEIVADELKDPTDHEECRGYHPKPAHKKTELHHQDRDRDHRYPHAVRQPIYGVLVALCVFLDPLIPTASSHHNFASQWISLLSHKRTR